MPKRCDTLLVIRKIILQPQAYHKYCFFKEFGVPTIKGLRCEIYSTSKMSKTDAVVELSPLHWWCDHGALAVVVKQDRDLDYYKLETAYFNQKNIGTSFKYYNYEDRAISVIIEIKIEVDNKVHLYAAEGRIFDDGSYELRSPWIELGIDSSTSIDPKIFFMTEELVLVDDAIPSITDRYQVCSHILSETRNWESVLLYTRTFICGSAYIDYDLNTKPYQSSGFTTKGIEWFGGFK